MTKGDRAETPEKRILELRDWVKSNYRHLLAGAIDANPSADFSACMEDLLDRVKREAMNRYVLLPAVAKGYAESSISPFFEKFEKDLKAEAAAQAKKTKAELGVLLARSPRDTASRKAAIDCLNILSKDGALVERALWVQALVKTSKIDEEAASAAILRLSREGLVFESKPGYYKRLQG